MANLIGSKEVVHHVYDVHSLSTQRKEEYVIKGTTNKNHRTNGPAVIWANGGWNWALNHKCHRYYGPDSDRNFWHLHGDFIK